MRKRKPTFDQPQPFDDLHAYVFARAAADLRDRAAVLDETVDQPLDPRQVVNRLEQVAALAFAETDRLLRDLDDPDPRRQTAAHQALVRLNRMPQELDVDQLTGLAPQEVYRDLDEEELRQMAAGRWFVEQRPLQAPPNPYEYTPAERERRAEALAARLPEGILLHTGGTSVLAEGAAFPALPDMAAPMPAKRWLTKGS